jgi:DNA-binding CsgD family transcriptional regulator
MQGVVAVDRGELASAHEHLEAARGSGARIFDGRINGLLFRALAELALWEGRVDEAQEAVARGIDQTGDDEMLARLGWLGLRAGADRAERERLDGRPVPAAVQEEAFGLTALLHRLDERARARRAPAASEVRSAVASGVAERARLDGGDDPVLWADAVQRWDTLGFPAPAAYARWRLAAALLASGRRADSVGAWRDAHRAARRLGTGPLQEAIESAAARAVVSLDDAAGEEPAGDEVRPYNLTARELEVLTLVAAGHTNRQIGEALFISEKTASVHVSRILGKLGASSRAQAAALAGQIGLTGRRA